MMFCWKLYHLGARLDTTHNRRDSYFSDSLYWKDQRSRFLSAIGADREPRWENSSDRETDRLDLYTHNYKCA